MKSPIIDPDVLEPLRYEIAYLRGKITVYEKFLKDHGYIKEEENDKRAKTKKEMDRAG